MVRREMRDAGKRESWLPWTPWLLKVNLGVCGLG